MKKYLLITLSLLSSYTIAGECNSLDDCLEKVDGKKNKYFHGLKKENKKFFFSFEGEKINPDLVSFMLRSNGFSRIKIKENLFEIINSRDLRYRKSPAVKASFKQTPDLKNTADFKMMIYKLKSDFVHSSTISRNLRPFLSRYGRIVDVRYPATIMVIDSEDNLQKLYGLIKNLDIPLSKEKYRKLEKKRVKNKSIKKRHKERILNKAS